MIVVADTSPILYPVLIDCVRLLESLYGSVIIPDVVAGELGAPASHRRCEAGFPHRRRGFEWSRRRRSN
jgi:predicted nucleic acid-binding protein